MLLTGISSYPMEVEVRSVDVPEMNDLAKLLDEAAGWTQDVTFVDPHRVDLWTQYHG